MSAVSSIPGVCVHTCDGDGCGESYTTASFVDPCPDGWWDDPESWITLCPAHRIPVSVQRELSRLQTEESILGAMMERVTMLETALRAVLDTAPEGGTPWVSAMARAQRVLDGRAR